MSVVLTGNFNPRRHVALWGTVSRVQSALGVDDQRMAELMRFKPAEFYEARLHLRELPAGNILELAVNLNLPLESLFNGQIDYLTLRKRVLGSTLELPERYLEGANSKRRTVINILDYIERRWGAGIRAQALRHLQVSDSMLQDPDALINLRLSVDLCRWLAERYATPQDFVAMGLNSPSTHKDSALGKALAGARNSRELFEMMFSGCLESFVERNFKWVLRSVNDESAVLEGIPDEDITQILGKTYAFDETVCLVRMGFAMSVPNYLGLGYANVNRTQCVSRGDSRIRFDIHFPSLSKVTALR